MVCNNCGKVFPSDQINVVTGGCNPIPLDKTHRRRPADHHRRQPAAQGVQYFLIRPDAGPDGLTPTEAPYRRLQQPAAPQVARGVPGRRAARRHRHRGRAAHAQPGADGAGAEQPGDVRRQHRRRAADGRALADLRRRHPGRRVRRARRTSGRPTWRASRRSPTATTSPSSRPSCSAPSASSGRQGLLMGVQPENEFDLKKWWSVDGRPPRNGHELVAGSAAAAALHLRTGDRVSVDGRRFTVTGHPAARPAPRTTTC